MTRRKMKPPQGTAASFCRGSNAWGHDNVPSSAPTKVPDIQIDNGTAATNGTCRGAQGSIAFAAVQSVTSRGRQYRFHRQIKRSAITE